MAGLLGLSGPAQLPGMGLLGRLFNEPSKGLLGTDAAALLNPTSMRHAQISEALTQAGLAMMNPDPHAPPSGIGGIIGRAAAGGFQGAQLGKQNYINDTLL